MKKRNKTIFLFIGEDLCKGLPTTRGIIRPSKFSGKKIQN